MILKEKTIYKYFSSLYFIKEIKGNGIFAYSILENNSFIINKADNFIMNYMEYISVGDFWEHKNNLSKIKILDISLENSEIKIKIEYYVDVIPEIKIVNLCWFIARCNKIKIKEEKMNCTKKDYLVSNCTTGHGSKVSASSPEEALEKIQHIPGLVCVFDIQSQKFYFFKTRLVLDVC